MVSCKKMFKTYEFHTFGDPWLKKNLAGSGSGSDSSSGWLAVAGWSLQACPGLLGGWRRAPEEPCDGRGKALEGSGMASGGP